LITKLLVQK
jgi:hypothetical protein